MMDTASGPTARDLMRIAREHGYSVSEHQLERWRGAGLLPRPEERPGQGYGRGRVGIYPVGTERQLLALLRFRREDRRIAYWGWQLWGAGFPVIDFVRGRLIEYFGEIERRLRESLQRFEDGEQENPIDKAGQLKLRGELAKVRRRIGSDLLPTSVRAYLEILSGSFDGSWMTDEGDFQAVLRMWKLKERRSMDAEYLPETLSLFSMVFDVPAMRRAAEEVSDEDLLRVRREVRAAIDLFDPHLPLTYGAFLMGFIIRIGSPPLREWSDAFLTNPENADLRTQILHDLDYHRDNEQQNR